jgi:hypothetical protein
MDSQVAMSMNTLFFWSHNRGFKTLLKAIARLMLWVSMGDKLIDYSKNIIMTFDHYVIKLEQKLQH